MDFYPVFMNIRGKSCLVVGGGEVAARKVATLLQCGAKVTVVAPQLGAALEPQAKAGAINYCCARFSEDHLQGVTLVIAATDDMEVNREVSSDAKSRNIPVNVVDNPALCSFILPSIIDRSPMVVAVSTGGASPVLARLLRGRLETLIPATYGRLASIAESLRQTVKNRLSHSGKRRAFWEKMLQGPFAEMVFAGQDKAAKTYFEQALFAQSDIPMQGEVYLVGAGPGNPDLLTLRALRLLQQADVILYDHLVAPAILELARRDAERIYVGKEASKHSMRQEAINDLLVKLAKEGKRVLRLKGGDPFIFGRGGEEIDTLSSYGIPFQVVPGITAANGVSAYAGIPLTHRDYAQSCVFVTGHLKDGSMNLDWETLVNPRQTIVIYMGLTGLPVLCKELVTHGLAAATPAAIVQQGTTNQQKVLTGTLKTLPGLAEKAKLKPPTLVIVGEVVRLHDKLAWFEPEPKETSALKSTAVAING
jgi:uroporphyrin-III C-methyltransferase/precorrin-2 dehydrogenase/sirohydrochlorin ferrochelatase